MPPTTVGAFQLIPITVELVIAPLFMRELGGSGLVKITAPYPGIESYELPTTLVASTVAQMPDPQARL